MDFFDDINRQISKTNNVLSCMKQLLSLDLSRYKTFFKDCNDCKYYKHIVYKNDLFEIIVIKWNKGSETKIHSHPKNWCLLKLIEGKLKENRYINNNLYQTSIIEENNVGYMHDNIGQHKIISLEDSYSVHLYSPPNYYN